MNYEKINLNGNYEVIRGIFEEHWGPMKDEDYATFFSKLPQEGVFAVDDDHGIVGTLFLYYTNSSMAISAFPSLSKKIKTGRKEVLNKMTEYVEFTAKYNGFLYMNTWSSTKSIMSLLRDRDYKVADVGVSHYIKPLI